VTHVFISYSHRDSDYAHELEDALQQRGFSVWIDERIDYGTRWPQVIEERLDACAALIVLMTPRSRGSNWVQNELARAQYKGKPIFPLLLEGEPWLAVQATQYVDVRDGKLPAERFYDRLGQVLLTPDTPTPSPPASGATAERRPVAAWPARGSRPLWMWVAGSVLALAVLVGGSYLGIRSALQPGTVPAKTPTNAPTATSAPTITPTSALEAGATRIRDKDGALMVYVPAGEFWMGSTDQEIDAALAACKECEREWFAIEQPQHKVRLEAFWIDRTEVTNVQYRRCVAASVCSPPGMFISASRDRYYDDPKFDDYPVVYVTWDQARTYAEWAGGRLPTEAEWEYACRGPGGEIYPWGDSAPSDSLLNYGGHVGDTTKVGSYPDGRSWCGALDMGGNVWEWTQSLDKAYPYAALDSRENLDLGGIRVVRGGAFYDASGAVRCACRGGFNPAQDVGFRVCVVAQ